MRQYVDDANLGKTGACHIFRHTMATVMLERRADIRFIQQMLGHACLDTIEIYTHVSIRSLCAVHAATHPTAKIPRPAETTPPEETTPTAGDGKAALAQHPSLAASSAAARLGCVLADDDGDEDFDE